MLLAHNLPAVLLMVVVLSWSFTAAQECSNGEVKGTEELYDSDAGEVEYCHSGEWKRVCYKGWTDRAANIACKQLGYSCRSSKAGINGNNCNQTNSHVMIVCRGTEDSLEDCDVEDCPCDNSGIEDYKEARVACRRVCCADGEVRLVGGSTNREGRLEVCMDGRWGTVCNNNQEGIAGAVCSQLDFPIAATSNTFFRSGPLIHNCAVQDNGGLICAEITDGSCDHTMDLGLVCNSTSMPPSDIGEFTVPALIAAVGLLVVLQTVTLTVCIVCCCTAQKKQSKDKKLSSPVTKSNSFTDQRYESSSVTTDGKSHSFNEQRNQSYHQIDVPPHDDTRQLQHGNYYSASSKSETVTTNVDEQDFYDDIVHNRSLRKTSKGTPANPPPPEGEYINFNNTEDHSYSMGDRKKLSNGGEEF